MLRLLRLTFLLGVQTFLLGVPITQATVITEGCANSGQSCSLSELYGGGSIIIDDKRFDEWVIEDFSNVSVALDAIDVILLDDQPLNPGLRFDVNGALATDGRDLIDLSIGFTVSTVDGSARIKDNSLEIEAFAFGPNNVGGFIEIFEDILDPNILDPDLARIGEKFVTADILPERVFDLFDSAQFSPQAQIRVQTLILVSGDADGDTVSLERFTQRFSQVPEPSVLMLFGVGLAGLGLSRRREVHM